MLDELLGYLITEMAMDGEEGCSVARLDGFIHTYHSRPLNRICADPPQLLDTAYKNFVWEKLCELDQVRLGVLGTPQTNESLDAVEITTNHIHPLELPAIVSNASNHMTQRKTRPSLSASKRSQTGRKSSASAAHLTPGIPALSIGQQRAIQTGKVPKNRTGASDPTSENMSKRSRQETKPKAALSLREWRQLDFEDVCGLGRDELLQKYGFDVDGQSRLRIAVDPMSCWRAVVGTDTRNPKLTPYVYQVLCIVAQGREAGATVIELGRQLKHDQKSLFHFVKVLSDMQLVTKFRAYQHKAWTNRVVHKRYLATSEWYKDFLKTDNPLNSTTATSSALGNPLFQDAPDNPVPDVLGILHNSSFETPALPPLSKSDTQSIGNILDSLQDIQNHVPLSPITKEHLAVNEPLIRSRIHTVLKRSPYHSMLHSEIIKSIGIAAPTKDDRRRLNRHIDTYIKRGFLEKVAIVNIAGHSPCIRLTASGLSSMDDTPKPAIPTNAEPPGEEEDGEVFVLPITRSIGQVIFELLTEAGQDGMIYKDLCRNLNDIEIRTAEQILTRMERDHPPPHLSDLRIASVLETSGREKRVRWFSSEALRQRCQASAIALPDDEQDLEGVIDQVGGFIDFSPLSLSQVFYGTIKELYKVNVPDPKGVWGKKSSKRPPTAPPQIGRPRKYPKNISAAERKFLKARNAAAAIVTDELATLTSIYERSTTSIECAPGAVARNAGESCQLVQSKKRQAPEPPPSKARAQKRRKRITIAGKESRLDEDNEKTTKDDRHDILPVTIESPDLSKGNCEEDIGNQLTQNVPIEPATAQTTGRALRPRRKTANYVIESVITHVGKDKAVDKSTTTQNGKSVDRHKVCCIGAATDPDPPPEEPIFHEDDDSDPGANKSSALSSSSEPALPQPVQTRSTRPVAPRLVTAVPPRVIRQNLTTLNREQQLLEAVRYAGGIAEKSHELAKAVRDLAHPDQQDSVTNLMDSRTLNTTLYALQTRGEIKMTTVLVPDSLGTPVHRPIVYLANIALDSADMISWLDEMRFRAKLFSERPNNAARKLLDFESDRPISVSAAKKAAKRKDSNTPSDEALRVAFRGQWRCVAQLYGFLMGRVARAQALHIFLLKMFQDNPQQATSTLFMNGPCRMFACGVLFQDMPINVFVKMVPIMTHSEEFETFREIPGAMEKPMSQCPLSIRRLLKIGHQFSRQKVYQTVEILVNLQLLVPLTKTTQVTEYTRLAPNGDTIYYEPCQMNMCVGLFCLANEASVYKFSETPSAAPSLLARWPLKDQDDGQWFWTELRRASLPDPEAPPVQQALGSLGCDGGDGLGSPFPASHKIAPLLTDRTKWHSTVQMTWSQREHAIRFDRQRKNPPVDLEKDVEELERWAGILSTTSEALKNVILSVRKAAEKKSTISKKQQKEKKLRADAMSKIEIEERLRIARDEAARMLAEKAKNSLKQKEDDWNSIVKRFKAESHVEDIDETVLDDLHVLFTAPTRGINATQVGLELSLWLKRRETLREEQPLKEDQVVATIAPEEPTVTRKSGQLPLLPSVKAKLLNMKKRRTIKRTKLRKQLPKKLPDRPLRCSAIAARAIRPQPNADVGSRPQPIQAVPGKRVRVEWTDTLDEYLRDLVAIIRARAYATSASLLPWTIATSVFKGIRQAMLKNRLLKLERDPLEKAYIDLLTDAWTQLYFEKRGQVKELPDPSPANPGILNGGLALDYLRSNIDKAYLRSHVNLPAEDAVCEVPLPQTLDELHTLYQVKQQSKPSERWDQVSLPVNNVLREEITMNEAFSMTTTYSGQIATHPHQPSHLVMRACEAIKILTSTSVETYAEPIATRLLSHYGENVLISATAYLHKLGIITYGSKIHYRKRLPGRSYCYTDKFMSAHDARVAQRKLDSAIDQFYRLCAASDEGKMNWSLFATDTETAALLHAFTDNRACLELDIFVNRAKRWKTPSLYRTRMLGDDALENDVKVLLHASHGPRPSEPVVSPASPQEHWELVRTTVREAGTEGLRPDTLVSELSPHMTQEEIGEAVEYLVKTQPPALYWVCEIETYIVAAEYLAHWGQKTNPMVNEPHLAYIIPRVWYDIFGVRLEHVWQSSLDRIESLILNIPGIPMRELTRHTQFHLNALERYDVLEELIRTGRIATCVPGTGSKKRWIRGFSEDRFWSVL